jgi:hypothetical protein
VRGKVALTPRAKERDAGSIGNLGCQKLAASRFRLSSGATSNSHRWRVGPWTVRLRPRFYPWFARVPAANLRQEPPRAPQQAARSRPLTHHSPLVDSGLWEESNFLSLKWKNPRGLFGK